MKQEAIEELNRFLNKSGGTIQPKALVDFARDESTALHNYFTWDDGEAAEKYRIIEARGIIRVHVTVEPYTQETVRAFVSLTTDRKTGAGYRAMADVIDDNELFAQLIEDAKRELESFSRKYKRLRDIAEFNDVFMAIDGIETSKKESTAIQAVA